MSRCEGCGGEDCICCEVFIEEQAEVRYGRMYEDDREYDEYAPIEYEEDD